LFLRQLTYQSAYQLDAIALHSLFLRVRGVAVVGLVVVAFFQTLILVLQLAHPIKRQVSADGEAEGFYRFNVIPLLPAVPHLYHRVLYYILCLCRVEGDAEGKPVELVLQR
jgi:hypothetical protein